MLACNLFRGFGNGQRDPTSKIRVGTGCAVIDDALCGGFSHALGGISCISGGSGTGKTTIALNVLASHLLAQSSWHVAVIDTTGTFDVVRLLDVLIHRLRAQVCSESTSVASDEELAKRAEGLLERVRIMRVFDFTGLMEAIRELKEKLGEPNRMVVEHGRGIGSGRTESGCNKVTRAMIPDSEDEDDEMLLDPSPEKNLDGLEETLSMESDEVTKEAENLLKMIVIDNVTHVAGPTLKKNYVQGQAFLTSFLRELTYLSRENRLGVILLNTTVTPRDVPSEKSEGTMPDQTNAARENLPNCINQHSIFTSTTSYPALGKTFPYYLDVHVLLSSLPRTTANAVNIYGSGNGRISATKPAQLVNVLEVLADRWEARIGHWCSFTIEKGVELLPS
ncbi:P-loop containing nucleoside triphosphate hydrolase protein [Lineolata rhizophorae]|uniref:P-loop containing nucleoside triphosphate hydrolase protein n=1 Tax=Lineolata rhizophorae TaxID=578093 RepID=A0A6A6NW57_9PEZI|nr:P-loop containing nucleoside triphosphate hydrolase protein [Lineolata rhizophorae]